MINCQLTILYELHHRSSRIEFWIHHKILIHFQINSYIIHAQSDQNYCVNRLVIMILVLICHNDFKCWCVVMILSVDYPHKLTLILSMSAVTQITLLTIGGMLSCRGGLCWSFSNKFWTACNSSVNTVTSCSSLSFKCACQIRKIAHITNSSISWLYSILHKVSNRWFFQCRKKLSEIH